MRLVGTILSCFFLVAAVTGLQSVEPSVSRGRFLGSSVAAAAGLLVGTTPYSTKTNAAEEKLLNLSNDKLKEIIQKDVVEKQYLCNGQLTRSVYDESATFTDEIDTYQLDQWITGTQKLFVGENSQVRLVGDINVSDEAVEFRFDEDLQFRIPLRPTVALTGKVILKRDPSSGLITSYQEFWDQDVSTVLKSAKFNFKL
ncbi:expressed unknown protein [Seminavis robusta]|uniref:Uncharacterized protein n=1 Tax=Seminavis robusta TaxID=568900 RepID=A0A9N8DZA1_9STRA|nr:expressed unknown protein [Seminavis robusta]|eukprot:Sro490_g153510.1 n/a (199) ;mRNA; f:36407-37003